MAARKRKKIKSVSRKRVYKTKARKTTKAATRAKVAHGTITVKF